MSRLARARRPRALLLALLACVALGALSLLLARGAAYDPWSWITWGKEILSLDLDTRGGPAWKPLPVVFTTVFGLFGDAAPDLWIVTSRALSLASLVAAGALVRRIAGPGWAGWAGAVLAALAVALMTGAYRAAAMATSEGLLVLCGILAVERHLAGRHRQALLFGVAAGLVRPEPWPLLLVYGLWMLRRREIGFLPLAGLGLGTLAIWFVPDLLATGDPLRSSARAQIPDRTSYSVRPGPVGAALGDLFGGLPLFTGIGLAGGALLALVRAGPRARMLAPVWLGLAWGGFVVVAIALGYAGSQRYLMGAIGVLAAAGGGGWALLLSTGWAGLRSWRAPWRAALGVATTAAAVFVVLSFVERIGDLDRTNFAAGRAADEREELPAIIARAGGAEAVRERCGAIATGAFQPPLVAWYLDAPLLRVKGTRDGVLPESPTTLQVQGLDEPFVPYVRGDARLLVTGAHWRLWSREPACGRAQAATAGTGNSRRTP